MSAPPITIAPLGDQALLVSGPSPLDLAAALEQAAPPGVVDLVPAGDWRSLRHIYERRAWQLIRTRFSR